MSVTDVTREELWAKQHLSCKNIDYASLIPALNSLFSGFSTIPYFRWLYMPILIMALASAAILDQREGLEEKKVKKVFVGYVSVFILMVGFIGLYPWSGESGHAVYRPLAYMPAT